MKRGLATFTICFVAFSMAELANAQGGAVDEFMPAQPGARVATPPAGAPRVTVAPGAVAAEPLVEVPVEQPAAGNANPQGGAGVNRMFLAIDVNNDGVITAAELRRAAASLKILDADNDGNITLAEATSLGPAAQGGQVVQMGGPNQMVDQMIAQNDKNGDGQLSPAEIPAQYGRMFSQWDANRDTFVTRDELAAAMAAMPMQFGMLGPGGGNGQAEQGIMQFDRNRDGRLTPDEVPPQMAGLLQGADQNRDGAIDAREMAMAMSQMSQRMGGRGLPPEMPMGNRGRGTRGQ